MSLLVEQDRLERDLAGVRAHLTADSAILHTDLLKIGLLDLKRDRSDLCSEYFRLIFGAFDGMSLLFPTFNYDYGQTRVYSVEQDPCQVGALNEHVRLRKPQNRTRTPIFNFSVAGNGPHYSLLASENAFGPASTFGQLVARDGVVGFMGAEFSRNTFLHYVEEVLGVGYRYLKMFPGVIRSPAGDEHINLAFRVRPRGGVVDYNWAMLETDLEKKGLLRRYPLGIGSMLVFSAKEILAYWSGLLKKDELYFLTETSRRQIEGLYRKHGGRLTFEKMEEKVCEAR